MTCHLGPIRRSGDLYLVFRSVDGDSYVSLVDRAEIMETGADDDVMAIYEVNSAAQIREVRVEIKPTIRVGRWNVPNLMDPGRETFT